MNLEDGFSLGVFCVVLRIRFRFLIPKIPKIIETYKLQKKLQLGNRHINRPFHFHFELR